MSDGFNLPIIMNVPVEDEVKMNKEIDEELSYEYLRQEKIEKFYNKPNSKIRRLGDYLKDNENEILSYTEISEELQISESSIHLYISDLNFYKGFGTLWVPATKTIKIDNEIKKIPGYIRMITTDDNDYYKWDKRKTRTITTMSAVKKNGEKVAGSKIKLKEKIKIKNEI